MPTLRPFRLNAVAINIPKVPPQTITSNLFAASLSRLSWLYEPGKLETTSWTFCLSAKGKKKKKIVYKLRTF